MAATTSIRATTPRSWTPRRFQELTKAGYTAAKRKAEGASEAIRQFDPTVKETLSPGAAG
jgi:hypothetical protein